MPETHETKCSGRSWKRLSQKLAVVFLAFLTAGCAQTKMPSQSWLLPPPMAFNPTTVESDPDTLPPSVDNPKNQEETISKPLPPFSRIPSLSKGQTSFSPQEKISTDFSESRMVRLAVDEMPLADFLHHVFGELLGLNYILDESISHDKRKITLSIKDPISERHLYSLTTDLLQEKKLAATYKEGLYFIHEAKRGTNDKAAIAVGIGDQPEDIPKTSGQVVQLVNYRYDDTSSAERLIRELTDAIARTDKNKKLLIIKGSAAAVARAIQVLHLMDSPHAQGRHIALIRLTYMPPEEFIAQVSSLLENEGIKIAQNSQDSGSVTMSTLPRINGVVIFSSEALFLDRIRNWAKRLDQPKPGVDKQYFLYFPENISAEMLGESLEALLSLNDGGANTSSGNKSVGEKSSTKSTSTEPNKKKAKAITSGTGSKEDDAHNVGLVVDSNRNALIFYSTPMRYQSLLPVLEQLDVLPPQVVLETTLAEVTLTGKLTHGLEWFLQDAGNHSDFSLGTLGNIGLAAGGLEYALTAMDGDLQIMLQFLESENQLNILSSPRLVVRSGESASISIGTEIPLITQQASDIDASSDTLIQTIQYRNTGANLNIAPIIYGSGVVAIEVSQEVSEAGENTLSGVDSPIVVNRAIDTKLFVRDGQTVILGGLISENNSGAATKVPILGDLPVIGKLFRTDSISDTRTELIILITPHILRTDADFEELSRAFTKEFQGLSLTGTAEELPVSAP
ncbi:MAG: hypothetical protein HQL52_15500 [Magnetococcales bacterium]|nr:hypothetical protein [Magnetococcales bacterium]